MVMKGPGKYDATCTAAMLALNAEGVILIVMNGTNGNGFSANYASLKAQAATPAVLRSVADQMEQDIKEQQTTNER